ncbi:hybrid sensor histidine kinase/response regulator [Rhodopirellula sp. JC639]|uniref:hybrid sensor histidine kinase/response regulator n=1 Tax=Stieleria mannarensis TaxID=2755585 RepID=UPI0015FF41AF|nr:ATP-binding protein [Rhodopirellula sp. JC639]
MTLIRVIPLTPESFEALASTLGDPLVLLSPGGVIVGANRLAVQAMGRQKKSDVLQHRLQDFVAQPHADLDEWFRLARRTTEGTLGTLKFQCRDQPLRASAHRINNGTSYFLLLRLQEHAAALKQFTALNEKVQQLHREVSRRRIVEAQLRIERDIAAFGRDIGLALVGNHDLDNSLQDCTELMVRQLDGALARIWLANEEGTSLNLVASSGLYTHLDGTHGCIRFGDYKIGRIAQEQRAHITNDVLSDPAIHDKDWARREGIVAFVGYPLVDGHTTVGVIGMFARRVLSESVSTAMGSVANSIALRIRKQAIQDGLAKQTQALKEADRRKDEFLAMLSHELRNPLAPVRSGLDLLSLSETQHRDTIAMMQRQIEHLVRLVDDLLDVSRIMLGKVELRKQPVALASLIAQAHDTLRETMETEGHHFEINMPCEPIWINADSVRIIQVIENLLKNACKYTDPGGEISINVDSDGNRVTLAVKDNGIGIDSDLLPQVFDLFTQADRALDRAQGGLGIGLTLTKNLVEMHRGSIHVCSAGLGRGTTFTLNLPTCVAPTADSGAAVQTHLPADAPLRILAVDDNRAARFMMEKLLEKLGPHEVKTAGDGPSAIKLFVEFQPELVFMDIGLPGQDGYEIARQIRQLETGTPCRLVALTGYGQQDDREKSKQAGFDEHLVKPPGIDQIRELLASPRV